MMPTAWFKDLCIDAVRPSVVADFWGPTLGLVKELQDGGDAVLRGTRPERSVWVNGVAEPKSVKNRVHLDLVAPSIVPMLAAGASELERVSGDPDSWTVMADPDGAELCVFDASRGEPSAIVIDSADPVAAARWWADAFGGTPVPGPDGALRWVSDVPGLPFDVVKHVGVPEPKTVKNRVHWDVVSDDVEALIAMGARTLREPDGDVQWHVLADPDGNEFCVFAP